MLRYLITFQLPLFYKWSPECVEHDVEMNKEAYHTAGCTQTWIVSNPSLTDARPL